MTLHILNASSESVVSCLGSTTVHWSVQYSCDQNGCHCTVYSSQAVSVHVSTLHKIVLKCTDSVQMLRWMVEGVSRLNRIKNADYSGRLNQEGA